MDPTNELTNELIARHGIGPGWWFGKRFAIRWNELDGFGHVNHCTHLVWCEEARNGYLAALGCDTFSADKAGPVVKRVGFTYERALRLGDEVIVTGRVTWVRRTSFGMEYAAWSAGLAGFGDAACVWLVNATGERVPVPDDLRRLMLDRDGGRDLRESAG
jgi:acyl-CoA thioester hydrolase